MNFRTEISFPKILDIDYKSSFYTIGSCFSNVIGEKIDSYKIKATINPFGNIYNPISIFKLLISNDISDVSYIERDGIWYNYNFHSDLRAENKAELEKKIQTEITNSRKRMAKANLVLITLGTSFVYKHLENNELVSNCHKTPQKEFSKELLTTDIILEEFGDLHNYISQINPECKIIFTISPVRHIKDTLELNSVSKSVLRIACHKLQELYSNVYYFPSYEIMMDDLRDYRFYKNDLIHPTPFAENYIWNIFKKSLFNKESLELMNEWDKISTSLNHKTFNPNTDKHQTFLKNILKQLEQLNLKVNCSKEIERVKAQVIQTN